jgi:hypothetical protein
MREIRGIILQGSFYDRKTGEVVSRITRIEVMEHLQGPIDVHLVPDVEKGEVLINLQGSGSLQLEENPKQHDLTLE